MKIYEMYGRQAEQMQEYVEFHTRTMQLLTDLKTGAASLDKVTIQSTGWTVEHSAEYDELPPKRNG